MDEKKLIFQDDDINQNTFHQLKHKQPININKEDINKIAISDKDSYVKKGSFKYLIGCKSKRGIRP